MGTTFGEKKFRKNKKRIFLTGVTCVGKTAIGKQLSMVLQVPFYDLDREVETYFGTTIEKLQNRFLTINSFRSQTAKVLSHLLATPEGSHCVIALPPSGLMGIYYRTIRKFGGTTIVLIDTPENILKRITFYDKESRQIMNVLSNKERTYYFQRIKEDISYFRRWYHNADVHIDITGLNIEDAAFMIATLVRNKRKDFALKLSTRGNQPDWLNSFKPL